MKTVLVAMIVLFSTAASVDVDVVSYGSSIKLQHVPTGRRLHSHDIKYAQGSGQQSVTGISHAHDSNSLWLVKPGHGDAMMPQGQPIGCGSVIRLEHINSGCNLHTHKIPAGLSKKWEVSAFGFRDESGDSGDNFELICNGKKSGEWKRFDTVMLRHVDTKLYVSASSKFEYHVHPVEGQMEIYSTEKAGAHAHWKTNEGFYFTKHLTN